MMAWKPGVLGTVTLTAASTHLPQYSFDDMPIRNQLSHPLCVTDPTP